MNPLHNKEQPAERKWYAVHTYSGYEDAVARYLKQRVESLMMSDKIFAVVVPKETKIKVKNGKRVVQEEKIYPGYVLVEMIVDDASWYVVRNTPNVTGFLGAGTIPVPVSGAELDQLKGSLTEKNTAFTIKLQIGDFVVIKAGAFEGRGGKITEINEEKGLVKVEINILGRDTPVEIDFTNVKTKK